MTNNTVAEALKHVLADSYALYLKTQNYHWNVEGPQFHSLHTLFETQYQDLAAAIDEIAELIRGLGVKAPGSFAAYTAVTHIKAGDENASAQTMVKELADDQEIIRKCLQSALETAQKVEDEVVTDALIARLTVHRQNQWMLRSSAA